MINLTQEKKYKSQDEIFKRGGLTVGLRKGDSVFIGDDIEVIIQHNNTKGSEFYQLRIIAPRDKDIKRSNYEYSNKPNDDITERN